MNLKERKRDDEGWQDFYLDSNFYHFTHGQQAAAALYDSVLLLPFSVCNLLPSPTFSYFYYTGRKVKKKKYRTGFISSRYLKTTAQIPPTQVQRD
jgi:hypothetical protein